MTDEEFSDDCKRIRKKLYAKRALPDDGIDDTALAIRQLTEAVLLLAEVNFERMYPGEY